jgi:hypothetical protein
MMVHVRGPGTIQGYEPCGVDSAHEDVLRHKVSLAPSEQLVPAPGRAQRRVPALPHAQKPVPVRVVAVLEPFVDSIVSWSSVLQTSSLIETLGGCIGE